MSAYLLYVINYFHFEIKMFYPAIRFNLAQRVKTKLELSWKFVIVHAQMKASGTRNER